MKTERAVVAGDAHFPFACDRAIKVFLDFLQWFKPQKVFLNGDITDCWEISKFIKPLSIEKRLKDELPQTKRFLQDVRRVAPNADIIYIWGNHEYRFEKYISLYARELYGLKGLTLEEQLGTKELRIRVVNSHQKENYYRYGKLLVGHFNRVNKHSAYTAKNLVEDKGISLIQNHTHRGGVSYKTDHSGVKVGIENFCLCALTPDYLMLPNWQQGFSVVYTYPSKRFDVKPMIILEGCVRYGDKEFGGAK